MADNYIISEGVDRSMGADDISAVLYPRVKLIFGADGINSGDVADANPLPIKITDGTNIASVRNTGSSDSLNVAIVDGSGNQITSFGGGTEYTEDAAAAADPVGKATILVRKDTPATVTGTDGDNVAQRGTNYGAAYCQIVTSTGSYVDTFGGGTQYAEDVAFGGNGTGTLMIARRDDALATLTPVENDAVGCRVNDRGALWVSIADGSGNQITSFGGGTEYTEDAAAAADPVGKATILVRKDTPATVTGTDGDNVAQRGTNYGAAYVQVLTSGGAYVDSFGGGTEYTEDAAAAADPVGKATILVRKDTPATVTGTDGDNVAQRGTNYGAAYVQLVTSAGAYIDSVGGGTQVSHSTASTLLGNLAGNVGWHRVTGDVVEAGSSATVINATSHVAKVGDAIRISSGTQADSWSIVTSVAANSITLGFALSGAPSTSDNFEIIRPVPITATRAGNGVAMQIALDSNFQANFTSCILKPEGGAHTSGDAGVMAVGVRNDAGATTFGADQQYCPIAVDANGRVGIADLGGSITIDGSLTNISGTISLPTGASTLAEQQTQTTALQILDDVVATDGSAAVAKLYQVGGTDGTNAQILSTNVSGHLNIADGGNVITVDGTVSAAQSGTWNITNVSGTVSLPTGAATLAEQQSQTTALQLIDDSVVTMGTTTYTEATSKGLAISAVRRDADTPLANTTNEFSPLITDANGYLKVEIFDGGGSHTVDGTVGATQSGTWVLGANSGVDIGDVTINNASGGSAVNIQDGGNAITVDNGGTFAVQVDGSALTALQLIDDIVHSGDAVLSKYAVMGAVLDDTGTATVTENQAHALRMTSARGLHVSLRDSTGDSAMDDANNALRVNIVAGGAGDGAILDGVSGSIKATVLDYTNSNPLAVRLTDTNGDYVGAGAGTQYTEDAAAAADPIGTALILIRKDTPATITGTDGDNVAQRGTNYGAAYVQVVTSAGAYVDSFGGGTEYTEDVAAAADPVGKATILVRKDTPATVTGTDGDNVAQRGTNYGAAYVQVVTSAGAYVDTFGGGTQYTEDAAAAADPVGTMAMAVRADSLAAVTTTDGDNIALRSTNKGEQYVKHVDSIPVTDNAGSLTVDNDGTFAVQVNGAALTALQLIDDPVQVLGTDTFTEASSKGMTLGAVRRDADTSLVNTTNEFAPLQVDALGRLKVEIFDGGDSHTIDGTVTASNVTGSVASGSGDSGNPVKVGGRAINALPTAEANNDRMDFVTDLWGRQLTTSIDPAMQVSKSFNATTTQTGTDVWDPAASKRIAVTSLIIGTYGTTAARVILWFGDNADTTYTAGTDQVLFAASFAPSATVKPGAVINFDPPIFCTTADRELHITTDAGISIDVTVHGYEW